MNYICDECKGSNIKRKKKLRWEPIVLILLTFWCCPCPICLCLDESVFFEVTVVCKTCNKILEFSPSVWNS